MATTLPKKQVSLGLLLSLPEAEDTLLKASSQEDREELEQVYNGSENPRKFLDRNRRHSIVTFQALSTNSNLDPKIIESQPGVAERMKMLMETEANSLDRILLKYQDQNLQLRKGGPEPESEPQIRKTLR